MIFNKVNPKHLGGGVVLFEACLDLDWDNLLKRSDDLIQEEWSEMYSPGVDPETNEEIYVNKSGYFFHKHSIDIMPKRASAIHYKDNDDLRSIFSFIESSKDKCLLQYFELFPLAYKCVWWKVKGHILQYPKDVHLGSHSDTSGDYIYGVLEPHDQLALRNVITSLVYFNDSIDTKEELDGNNYMGGHHFFNYLDIDYSPKKGDIMFFPSNYMAAHEVKTVTEGFRYSYLGWYSQGTPNPAVHEYVADPLKEPELSRKSTNVYMPTLREDLKNHLLESGYKEDSPQFYITKSNY
jgi:hypothetical protein